MKTLILGALGFVGKNLLKHGTAIVFTENLLNYSASKKEIEEHAPDLIYNLASHGGSLHYVSKFAADVIHDNISMSLNLYKIASELPKKPTIINPISNCSYPGNSSIQLEENWLAGDVHKSVSSFGNSKRTLYHISKCYYNQHGIKSINLIFPNAFGVYDHTDPNKTHALDGMIIRMIKARKNQDKTFEVWGTGKPVREWIYSEDFAKLLILASAKDEIIEPINMAQNRGYSIAETAEIIKKATKYDGEIVFNTQYPDGDPIKILDNNKFKSVFGNYQFIDHVQGIEKTVEYYQLLL